MIGWHVSSAFTDFQCICDYFCYFVIAVFSLFISHYIPPYSVFIQQYLLYIALINTYKTIYTEINTICYQWVPSVKGLAKYYS